MSTAAAKILPTTVGNTARALPARGPERDATRKARTPLSLVQSVPGRRRTPFVVFCFGVLAAALMTVLVLNISVSTAQYDLVKLRNDDASLNKQNQDLTQQVQNYQAPQNLAAKAAELGMVASTATGQIDLDTLTVTGKATPATKGQNPGAVIAAPAVAGQSSVQPSAPPKNDSLDSRKPSGTADPTPAKPQAPVVPAAPKPPVVDLHGGSVPVPQQKVPGQ
jgi:cell division protein FtsL